MGEPGEFMLRKKIVDSVGVENLKNFNAGMMSFGQLMQSKKGAGESGVGYFDGGGLVGGRSAQSSSLLFSSRTDKFASAPRMVDNSQNFGDIIINNPRREHASSSLPTALRKVSYVATGKRKADARVGAGANDEQ
jgi:hypothetical protein